MTVHVVICHTHYDSSDVVAVFATAELATAYLATIPKSWQESATWFVEAWPVSVSLPPLEPPRHD